MNTHVQKRKVKKERCRSERYERRLTQRSLCSNTTCCPMAWQTPTSKRLRRFFAASNCAKFCPVPDLTWIGCQQATNGKRQSVLCRRQFRRHNYFCQFLAKLGPGGGGGGGGWPSPRWVSGTVGCCQAGTRRCTFSNLFPRCSNAAQLVCPHQH